MEEKQRKSEQLVKEVGDKVIEELFKLEKDYKYENDGEGYMSASYGIQFGYEYGNSYFELECSVSWPGHEIELLLYGVEGIHERRYKNLDRLQEAIQTYVSDNLDTDELLSAIEDNVRDFYADEWETHGFSGAADYYHWRYG